MIFVPPLVITAINESLSVKAKKFRSLVSHHLTRNQLKREAREFVQHYPDIRGPLVAVMMGGEMDKSRYADLAKKLTGIAGAYPEITFFICPSRRTGDGDKLLMKSLYSRSALLRAKIVFNNAASALGLCQQRRLSIRGVDYKEAVAGYNPYFGLLGRADHIVVAGDSQSMVSEALFAGKNIYYLGYCSDYEDLVRAGYVTDIKDVPSGRPFPTRRIERLNLTHEVAGALAEEYRKKTQENDAAGEPHERCAHQRPAAADPHEFMF